ncbi:MAG: 2-C-methyl-D-erythritol 4-phosphate cytidylyltransferase [Candidatus Kapaibacteriales bacterium]
MLIDYIIPAGGIGKRLGSTIPKQFIKLGKEPIIIRTIKALQSHPSTRNIVVSVHKDWIEHLELLVEKYELSNVLICQGSKTRSQSVINGLNLLGNCKYVGIHDAVRPFVTEDLITKLVKSLETNSAVIPILPIKSTLKHLSDPMEQSGFISKTQDREMFGLAQTPQLFDCSLYKKFISDIDTETMTDDASLFEAANEKVSYILGEETNIKITTPFDMDLAELIISKE